MILHNCFTLSGSFSPLENEGKGDPSVKHGKPNIPVLCLKKKKSSKISVNTFKREFHNPIWHREWGEDSNKI